MTDGNTHAIARYVDEREDWDALQEVTAELEQAESDNILLISRIEKLEADLLIALEALEKLARLGNGDHYGNSEGNMIARSTLAVLKGETDE